MISVLWGLLGALLIGTSDCIARITSQRVSITVLIILIMGMSSSLMTFWFIYSSEWPRWHLYGWSTSIISGLLNLIAVAFLYKALARGPVYVAAPATSSYSVILIIINVTIGELFTLTQLLAAFIVFFGITMLSTQPKNNNFENKYTTSWLRNTTLLGLGAGVTIALRFFFAQESLEYLGTEQSLYINRISAFLFIMIFFLINRPRKILYKWPRGNTIYFITLQAFLETVALAAFLYGSMNNGRIGATIGFSTFALVTSVVAWVWLGEKIPTNKFFWILIITFAIVLSIVYAPNS